jgi:hypothetical protein
MFQFSTPGICTFFLRLGFEKSNNINQREWTTEMNYCAALWERNLWNCRAHKTGDKKGERRKIAMECNVVKWTTTTI